ncbi:MAG: class I SAM-dependent methyltransferase [Planctomycetota bacterium]
MSIQNCPVCGNDRVSAYFHLRSNNLIALRCRHCTHVFVENSPINSSNIADFYTMNDFKGNRQLQNEQWYTNYYNDCFNDYDTHLDSSLVLKQFEEKLCYCGELLPQKGRLLDIGCATGVFLDMASKQGWEVEGLEVSSGLAAYARDNFGLKVHCLDLTKDHLDSPPFDVVTLFDLIEHIPNVNEMIKGCRNNLSDEGILIIRTPAEEGLLRDIAKILYNGSLRKFELPMLWFYSFEHIQSFSFRSLSRLLEQHNFSVIKVFHEEESLERLGIPKYIKFMIKGINYLSGMLNKQHKIVIIAKKIGL